MAQEGQGALTIPLNRDVQTVPVRRLANETTMEAVMEGTDTENTTGTALLSDGSTSMPARVKDPRSLLGPAHVIAATPGTQPVVDGSTSMPARMKDSRSLLGPAHTTVTELMVPLRSDESPSLLDQTHNPSSTWTRPHHTARWEYRRASPSGTLKEHIWTRPG